MLKKVARRKKRALTADERDFITEYRRQGCSLLQTASALKITPKEAERFLRSDIVKEHLMKSTAEVEERIQAMTPYLLDSAVYLLKTTKSDKVKLALINSLLEKAGIGDRKQAGVQININATIADRARSILAENLKNGTVIDINSQLGESPEEKQS